MFMLIIVILSDLGVATTNISGFVDKKQCDIAAQKVKIDVQIPQGMIGRWVSVKTSCVEVGPSYNK